MSCDKIEKDDKLGIWDENQDSVKILYFSSSGILVKKMGKRWSFFRISFSESTRLTPNLWIHPSQLLGVKKEMTPVTTNLTTTEMLRKVKKSHSPSLFYNKLGLLLLPVYLRLVFPSFYFS